MSAALHAVPSVRDKVSKEEWQIRTDLAATYRLVAHHGWADMIGLGVASFSHIGGTHFQNDHEFESYVSKLERSELPIYRALTPTPEERMIREFILQMKFGRVSPRYFAEKFAVNVFERFAPQLNRMREQGLAAWNEDEITLTRDGLLKVDELLHDFFLPEHREALIA